MYHLLAYSKHVQHYQQLSIDWYTGNPKLYSFVCCINIHPIHCTIRGTGNVPECPIASQISLSIGWIGRFGKHPMQYALSLLSIPSHCAMGWIGQNGNVPKCPMQNALSLLYVMGGIAREHLKSTCAIPICTVHPILLYCGWIENNRYTTRIQECFVALTNL